MNTREGNRERQRENANVFEAGGLQLIFFFAVLSRLDCNTCQAIATSSADLSYENSIHLQHFIAAAFESQVLISHSYPPLYTRLVLLDTSLDHVSDMIVEKSTP